MNQRPYTPIQFYSFAPPDKLLLVPYQEVTLSALTVDFDRYDLYDPETNEWLYDQDVADSVNFGETEERHHIEWTLEGHGSFPYADPNGNPLKCYGLWEDPYDIRECYQHHELTYRAGGPNETGLVKLHLTVDDNEVDGDPDDEAEGRNLRSGDDPLEQQIDIWVIEVQSLTWEKYSDNPGLDQCPNNGGKRIYPEKTSYHDTDDYRNRVNLKVTLSNQVPQGKSVQVKVKLFDVDDPKYSGSPVDAETPVTYNDNWCNDRSSAGSDIGASPGSAGYQREYTVTFNGGEQEKPVVVYINDPRPGNNWKAVASTRVNWVSGVHLDTDGLTFKDGNNAPVDAQCISPMLTVWRTLHVEKDVMDGEDYPDISLFQSAFAPAYIVVAYDTDTDNWNCTFYSTLQELLFSTFVAAWKGTISYTDYWAASLCGGHYGPYGNEGDSHYAQSQSAYPGGGQRCTYSWVWNQKIEDSEAAPASVKKKVALHECAHQFKLAKMHAHYYDDNHVCVAATGVASGDDLPTSFCPYCIRDLMREGYPGHH